MGWKRGRVVRKIKEQKKYARRNTEEERKGRRREGRREGEKRMFRSMFLEFLWYSVNHHCILGKEV